MNIAVVQGRVRTEPDRRLASDGSLLLSFDVVVERSQGRSPLDAGGVAAPNTIGAQVPVTWNGGEAKAPRFAAGDLVTVVGSVHRRFYRRGGATVSRTDVRADRVVRGSGLRASRAIAEAVASATDA